MFVGDQNRDPTPLFNRFGCSPRKTKALEAQKSLKNTKITVFGACLRASEENAQQVHLQLALQASLGQLAEFYKSLWPTSPGSTGHVLEREIRRFFQCRASILFELRREISTFGRLLEIHSGAMASFLVATLLAGYRWS